MSADPVPLSTPPSTNLGTSFASDTSSLPLWDRITTWASENKAAVYTIAGAAVVISGAGIVYYLLDSRRDPKDVGTEEKKKLSKKERRKAKQEKDKQQGQSGARSVPEQSKPEARAAAVESDPLEGVPQIDESTVETLSEQVSSRSTCVENHKLSDLRHGKNMLPS